MNRLLLALVSVGLLAAVVVSCTGQGEGQRCQVANNNDDCQSGLICYAANQITLPSGNTSNADICCLVDRSQSTEDICKLGSTSPGSDAGITDASATDGSPSDAATTDSATDGATTDGATTDGATTDAATDGSSDAKAD